MEGHYADPKHGHCLRRIYKQSPTRYLIVGVYGNDEAPKVGEMWTATVHMDPTPSWRGYHRLTVDFGGKTLLTHRVMYRAQWWPSRRVIAWEDGNRWHKLFVHHTQLR